VKASLIQAASAPELEAIGSVAAIEPRPPRFRLLHFLPRLVGDLVAAAVGLLVYGAATGNVGTFQFIYVGAYVIVAAVMDVTHVRREWNYVEEFVVAFKAAFVALVLTATVGFFVNRPISRILFVGMTGAMLVARPLAAIVADRLSASARRTCRVVTVCSDDEHNELAEAIDDAALSHVRLSRVSPVLMGGEPELAFSRLIEEAQKGEPVTVVVGPSYLDDASVQRTVVRLNESGITIRSLPRIFEELCGRVSIRRLDTDWFLFDMGPLHRVGYRVGRRMLDLIGGLLIGLVFALVLPIVTIMIKLTSSGPVLYVQRRVGQGGREFKMYKFRTMRCDAEDEGPRFASHRDPRITGPGRLLRRSRLDELPQAINLLRGEMSLIGPRPERPEWVDIFRASIPFYDKRNLIKPGVTGWAQVHEGYGATDEDATRKLERDLYYLRYQSLGLDLRISLATLGSLFRMAGR
jgi:exopolysaccharide biosynthesis polyprenyl glycosylphosphotransferase